MRVCVREREREREREMSYVSELGSCIVVQSLILLTQVYTHDDGTHFRGGSALFGRKTMEIRGDLKCC